MRSEREFREFLDANGEHEPDLDVQRARVDREREWSESEWWHAPAVPHEQVQDA